MSALVHFSGSEDTGSVVESSIALGRTGKQEVDRITQSAPVRYDRQASPKTCFGVQFYLKMATVYNEFLKTETEVSSQAFLHIPRQAAGEYHDGPVDYTYEQALRAADVLSEQYACAGYGCGMRVAVMLDNRAEFFLHLLALNKLGVSVVPVNSGFLPREIAYVINHSDACLVLCLPCHREKVRAALAGRDADIPITDTESMTLLPPCSELPNLARRTRIRR